jgi:outer membrane protein assembly factor BamB
MTLRKRLSIAEYKGWIFFTILLLFLGTLSLITAAQTSQPYPYIEPALLNQSESVISVIISAQDVDTAVRAVTNTGGTVTSHLWLINSIGATVPVSALYTIGQTPGIRYIVENKPVGVEGGVDCSAGPTETGSCSNQYGYETNQRRLLGMHASSSYQLTPSVNLQDGGSVTVAENGTVIILNADGTLRTKLTLPSGKPFNITPVVGLDGTIFVAGEDEQLFAVAPHGAIRWIFTNSKNFVASVSIATDGTVYAVDEKRNLFALDPLTGEVLWDFRVPKRDDDKEKTLSAPTVGLDGTIYVITDKGMLTAVSPTGSKVWSFAAGNDDDLFELSPFLAQNGTIYVTNKKGTLIAVNPNGSQKFRRSISGNVVAQPILGNDGTIYVTTKSPRVYAINPDGSVRFNFYAGSGNFDTSAALSPDGTQLYAGLREKKLFALDVTNGTKLWSYVTQGEIKGNPVVDTYGKIHIGEANGRFTILDANGNLLYSSRRFGNITQNMTLSDDESVIFFPTDDKNVVTLGLLSNAWDNAPDVAPTSDTNVYEFLNPVSIDVGADQLHDSYLQGGNPITGDGVAIAIIDSGIQFTDDVKAVLGDGVKDLFLGQANFVAEGLCGAEGGTQYSTYCFTNETKSYDAFGHGTHIAGTIWNQFIDYDTGVNVGIAPGAEIISVRVLNEEGKGTYEDVIEGIQYVVANKDTLNLRIINLSLSGMSTTPYFVDPLNRAVEQAWASGIVVLAAAGNSGPQAETIMVPGNDPYIITVGALDTNRTPGYWSDDTIPFWSASGPTLDGFIKPDVVAPGGNIVSYIYNDPNNINNSSKLVQDHPDYAINTNLFRMNGTSMATGVASGVVALMLDAQPSLTPDQVKFRLMASARFATTNGTADLAYNPLQQGSGRIWAPDAVHGSYTVEDGNQGLDILDDLAYPWEANDDPDPANNPDLAHHYQGLVRKMISDDGTVYLYYFDDPGEEDIVAIGAARTDNMIWIGRDVIENNNPSFGGGSMSWANGYAWAGGYGWLGGTGYGWLGGTGYGWLGGSGYGWLGGTGYGWLGGTGYGWLGGTGYGWLGGTGYGWLGGSSFDWTDETHDDWVSGLDTETTIIPVPQWINDNQPTPTPLPAPTATPTAVSVNFTAPTYELFIPMFVNSP